MLRTAERDEAFEALRCVEAAIGDRLLAEGPLSPGYAHAVIGKIKTALAPSEYERVVNPGAGDRSPAPTPPCSRMATPRPIWEFVVEDMTERDRVGRRRYGTPLQANNGRDALVDAYKQALDLAVYLRQAIAERGPTGG